MTFTPDDCRKCKANLSMGIARSRARDGRSHKWLDWDEICADCKAEQTRIAEEVAKREAEMAAEYEWRCGCGFSMPLTFSELPYLNPEAWRLCPLDGQMMFRLPATPPLPEACSKCEHHGGRVHTENFYGRDIEVWNYSACCGCPTMAELRKNRVPIDDDGKLRELYEQEKYESEAARQNLQAMHTGTPSN